MPSISIESLGPDDWQRFRAIRLRALADSPDAFGSTLEEAQEFTGEEWRQRLTSPDVATFVAGSAEATDTGLAVGAPYDNDAGLYGTWVAPEARGTGVGTALVEAVINWATQRGHKKVLLDVGDHNCAAIALYESKGFIRTGITGTLPPPRASIAEHQRAMNLNP